MTNLKLLQLAALIAGILFFGSRKVSGQSVKQSVTPKAANRDQQPRHQQEPEHSLERIAFPSVHDATEAALADIRTLDVQPHDWPQWGGSRFRNNVPHAENLPNFWDVETGLNIKWSARLGSVTFSNPVIANGHVYIGTNNHHGYVKRSPKTIDLGVLLCFDEQTGAFLWQFSNNKLLAGRVNDWPSQGIVATPVVAGDRLWIVTNRCEVVCLDTHGFQDTRNDGIYRSESSVNLDEADVLWRFDMKSELGVFPHNMSTCCIITVGNRLFVTTSNGVDESHVNIPAPSASSLICMDRDIGKVLWTDNSPGRNILHGQWASPSYGIFAGQPQVLFPAGDGWLYSFDPEGDGQGNSRLLWKFDANPKSGSYSVSGKHSRNHLVGFACIDDGLVYIAVGEDPEHGEGGGLLWCIDPTRREDVSPTILVDRSGVPVIDPKDGSRRLVALDAEAGEKEIPNPNSAAVWHFDKFDTNGNGDIEFEEEMHRTIGTAAIKDDLLYIADLSGMLHCLNAKTGVPYWHYDLFAACWGSPLIADGKVYIGDEDGDIAIFQHSSDPGIAMPAGAPIAEILMNSSVYSTPVVANGVLYITTKDTLYAITNDTSALPSPR